VVDATNVRLQQHNINVTAGYAHAEQKIATFMRICHIDSLDFVTNQRLQHGPALPAGDRAKAQRLLRNLPPPDVFRADRRPENVVCGH
jgi:hypothetical protein